MSIWSRFIKALEHSNGHSSEMTAEKRDPSRYAIVDVEVGTKDHKIHDIGAIRYDQSIFHQASKDALCDFLDGIDYLCGHNIIHHDARYLFGEQPPRWILVDTLYLSPLLFPEHPYHKLVKDDKLLIEQMNNPVNDCEKALDLLMDEISQWKSMSHDKQQLFASLLRGQQEFDGFLQMVDAPESVDQLPLLIYTLFEGKICSHAPPPNTHQPTPLRTGLCTGFGRHNRLPITHTWLGVAQLSGGGICAKMPTWHTMQRRMLLLQTAT